MNRTIVVVGGDAAGMSAAAKAKRTDPKSRVLVFERGPFVSYAACGLPYLVSGVVGEPERLLSRSVAEFQQQGIEVHLHCEVTELAAAKRWIGGEDREQGTSFQQPFDACVLATGAEAVRSHLPGDDAPNAFVLRSLADGLRLKDYLGSHSVRHATLVGGGFVSVEMAEALRTLGIAATLVEAQPRILSVMDEPMADLVVAELTRNGVTVIVGNEVQSLQVGNDDRIQGVETPTQGWRTDLVLFGVGVRPNTTLAVQAGLSLDVSGAIRTDRRQETDRPGIYAAGDCTSVRHRLTNRRVYLPLGTTANKQGRVAGENAAGGSAAFGEVVGSMVVKVFGLEVARTGLTEREATESGQETAAVQITASSRAAYYPGAVPLTVRLVAERESGRLLGGQLVGGEGAAIRVNIIAAALHAGLTVAEFAGLDLAYAPPYSPVWDPLLIAANELRKEL